MTYPVHASQHCRWHDCPEHNPSKDPAYTPPVQWPDGETRREMIEKSYGALKVGDTVWIAGALLRVTALVPVNPRTPTERRFEAECIRSGNTFDVGWRVEFGGLEYGRVLTEVLP